MSNGARRKENMKTFSGDAMLGKPREYTSTAIAMANTLDRIIPWAIINTPGHLVIFLASIRIAEGRSESTWVDGGA
jgi:hypothetical protein